MRKFITLVGFILVMFGIWGWSINVIGMGPYLPIFFFISIAGMATMIIGLVTHPKELKEPFKKIAEKFEEMNKPILIAAILIFFSSLWLLSYGFFGIFYYHASEILLSFPSPENATVADNFTKTVIHRYNDTFLISAYMEIFAGILCVASVVNTLEKRHLSFIISSLAFGSFTSILFVSCYKLLYNAWNADGATTIIGGYYFNIIVYLFFPIITSIVALFLIIWQYKEYAKR